MIIFTDEATFRQTPTLHATWAPRGCQPKIPTRGERHSQKIFGAVRLETAEFTYLHHQENFQWETYRAFLDQVVLPAFCRCGHRVYLIQDNAGYQKKAELYDWFAKIGNAWKFSICRPTGPNSTPPSEFGITPA